jgi:hypothetical protein
MVTKVPPAVLPLVGEIELTVGAATYVNRSALLGALAPPAVVTVTSTAPTLPAGEVAVMEVAELTVKLVTAIEPKFRAVAPVKPVPVITTEVPPAARPLVGDIAVIVGTATYVNRSALLVALVPPAVVTVT